jgi:CRP-like cAMP-binding protein
VQTAASLADQVWGTAFRTEAHAGRTFIAVGEPADCFFTITAGRAKLFKLQADGRGRITGFVGVGNFLDLTVSDNDAVSAEAIEPVRLCRFLHAKGVAQAAGRLPADGETANGGRGE